MERKVIGDPLTGRKAIRDSWFSIQHSPHSIRSIGRPPLDPEAYQRVIQSIDEQIARAFLLPTPLLGLPPSDYEPQRLTLEQVRQLRDTWMPVFKGEMQPVRDYCGDCYYSNKDGVRFCGLGLTMKVGCTQREHEQWEE